jgi:hypothetical protein
MKTGKDTTPHHSERSQRVSRDYHGRVLDQPGRPSGVRGVARVQALNPSRVIPSDRPGLITTMGPG